MTKTELMSLLMELGIHPSRKLGQNFLIDRNLLDWTVRTAGPQPGETILEVGPGTGVLTEQLLAAGADVTAVEVDHRLAAYLRERFAGNPHLRLLEEDACAVDWDALFGPTAYRCIANLPYAISSIVIARFLELPNPPREIYVLLQVEMAERMRAGPGTKAYGALSVHVQLRYHVELLRRISPQVFFPPPDVASAYVRFVLRPDPVPAALRPAVRRVVQLGFSQRRKQLRRLLTSAFPAAQVAGAFAELGLAEDARAEALTPEMLVRLAAALHPLR